MMPASKHGDPQLGIDIHPCVVPPSPSPVPLPTPHMSIVFDPFDYLPFVGTEITVCGMKRANAGTNGMTVHIPPGFPFAPKLPDKDDELFMGSMTVVADGEPFSFIAVPVLSCQLVGMPGIPRIKKKGPPKLMLLPTTFNLAIPTNVFVGGPPTISIMGMLGKLGFAALGKFGRSGVFKRMRQKMFGNLKPGFLKCKVLRAEPVNILSGEVSVEHEDFTLPGRIPVHWVRSYSSGRLREGLCGHGWETLADARLEVDPWSGVVSMHHPVAGPLYFQRLPKGVGDAGAELEMVDGALLRDTGGAYEVRTKEDRIYTFPKRLLSPRADGTREFPLESLSDPWGNGLQLERRGALPVAIRDSGGRCIELVYESRRIAEIRMTLPGDPQPHVFARYEYSASGDLLTVIDALGQPYRFGYDEHHLIRHTNRTGLSFYYEYDKEAPDGWRVVHTWGDGGLYEYRFVYDDLLRERRITNSLGQVSLVKLDQRGLPICEIDPLGGTTIFEYDEVGHTTALIDPDGQRTSYEYDELGNLIASESSDGARLEIEFKDRRPVKLVEPNGATWTQVWSSSGRLQERRSPSGAVHQYRYDPHGQLAAVTDPLGRETRFSFDSLGSLSRVHDALGGITSFDYDALGNVVRRKGPLDRITECLYDPLGRLTSIRGPAGGTVRFAYDAESRLTRYVDELGSSTFFEYFGIDRVRQRTEPDGGVVRYEYDTEERLTAIVDQAGQTHRLVRDGLGRVVREIDYAGREREFAYGPSGHIRQSMDATSVVTYKTSASGRIVERRVQSALDSEQSFVETFGYDVSGNIVRATNPSICIERSFDLLGRLVEEKQGSWFTIGYRYDAVGNLVSRRTSFRLGDDSIERSFDHVYDAADRPIELTIDGTRTLRMARDAAGQIVREDVLGLERRKDYDPNGNLLRQTLLSGRGKPLSSLAYGYDEAGNLVEREDSFGVDRFTYDPMRRVIAQVGSGGNRAHGYASSGSRIEASRHAAPHFDGSGDLRAMSRGQELWSLEWDGLHRLVRIAHGVERTEYTYDPFGRRIGKQTRDGQVLFAWDGNVLAGELERRSAGGKPGIERSQLREWIYLPRTFVPVAMLQRARRGPRRSEEAFVYVTDPNGCPVQMYDEAGTLKWAARIGVWGNAEELLCRQEDNPIRLQGQYHDPESGLHYNRHRYFDPAVGEFISPDPLGISAGTDPYAYGPQGIAYADPLGLSCQRAFYSVQSAADAARLARGGAPWPSGLSRANLGPGFYAWGSRADAEAYLKRLREHGAEDLQIVAHHIDEADLAKLRTLDLTKMSDDAVNEFMEKHSHYGDALPHDFEHVIRNTGMGAPEHYFSPDAFALFR